MTNNLNYIEKYRKLIMLKKSYLLIGLLLLLTVGCSSQKVAKNRDSEDLNASTLKISYNSSGCYGKCPVIEFIVFGNGQVVLNSQANYKLIGTYQGNISKDQVYKIMDKFEQADFWNLDSTYDNPLVTDLPTFTFEYFKFPKTKEVKMRFNAPKQLADLKKFILEQIESIKWEKVETKDPDQHD